MARIRTIKPEFFTSEDIVALSPLARLFYVSLWCESDREGRLSWRPGTLKMRYLPGDNCDVDLLAQELIDAELIVLYQVEGKTYAEIPTFKNHQVINNRESESIIPARVADASARVKAEGRKEGKGRERKEGMDDRSPNGSRLPQDWTLPDEWRQWANKERPELDVQLTAAKFHDFWIAKAGKDGRKLDWAATWRNWVRSQRKETRPINPADVARVTVPSKPDRDPVLVKLEQEALKAVGPTPEQRARMEELRRQARVSPNSQPHKTP